MRENLNDFLTLLGIKSPIFVLNQEGYLKELKKRKDKFDGSHPDDDPDKVFVTTHLAALTNVLTMRNPEEKNIQIVANLLKKANNTTISSFLKAIYTTNPDVYRQLINQALRPIPTLQSPNEILQKQIEDAKQAVQEYAEKRDKIHESPATSAAMKKATQESDLKYLKALSRLEALQEPDTQALIIKKATDTQETQITDYAKWLAEPTNQSRLPLSSQSSQEDVLTERTKEIFTLKKQAYIKNIREKKNLQDDIVRTHAKKLLKTIIELHHDAGSPLPWINACIDRLNSLKGHALIEAQLGLETLVETSKTIANQLATLQPYINHPSQLMAKIAAGAIESVQAAQRGELSERLNMTIINQLDACFLSLKDIQSQIDICQQLLNEISQYPFTSEPDEEDLLLKQYLLTQEKKLNQANKQTLVDLQRELEEQLSQLITCNEAIQACRNNQNTPPLIVEAQLQQLHDEFTTARRLHTEFISLSERTKCIQSKLSDKLPLTLIKFTDYVDTLTRLNRKYPDSSDLKNLLDKLDLAKKRDKHGMLKYLESLDNKLIEVRRIQCDILLHKIQQYGFGFEDKQMRELETKTINITKTGDLTRLNKHIAQLEKTLFILEKDPVTNLMQNTINSFEKRAGFFTIGMKAKAQALRKAIGSVPLLERQHLIKNMLSQQPQPDYVLSVKIALDKHRFGHLPFSKTTKSYNQFIELHNKQMKSDQINSGNDDSKTNKP